eukprot:TRINITY_DN6973_c0_g1_i11.p2 TRINITY_DN6973_c0_g1~~TRINITY_DN6973_c0_g1_i11.p2  ORF type:complete len:295 (-),score=24.33 TRINITY_DN6973_c0_g1_i11:1107-1991(-)
MLCNIGVADHKINSDQCLAPLNEDSNMSAHAWAANFYSLVTNRLYDEVIGASERSNCKELDERIKTLKYLFDHTVDFIGSKEAVVRNSINELLFRAFSYNPAPLGMKEIIKKMKVIEKAENMQLEYHKSGISSNKNLMEILLLADEYDGCGEELKDGGEKLEDGACTSCSESEYKKAGLMCGHVIRKKCLINSVLKVFLTKKPYKYEYRCEVYRKHATPRKLQLDCGCTATKFWEIMSSRKFEGEIVYRRCKKKHSFTLTDLCLINGNIDFKSASLIMNYHMRDRRDSELMKVQ